MSGSKEKKFIGMICQITIFFLIGVFAVGGLVAVVQYEVSLNSVKDQLSESAERSAKDIVGYVNSYPARDWLLRYWYENYDKLDIEYESTLHADSPTVKKTKLLISKYPGFQVGSATAQEVEALSPEDQKLYAEIIYSRLIYELDRHQNDYDLDYVFCIVAQPPYDANFLLFISSDGTRERGSEKGMIYPMGKIMHANEQQQKAIALAASDQPQLALNNDGTFLDYFYPLRQIGKHDYVLCVTRSLEMYNAKVFERTLRLTLISMAFVAVMAVLCLLLVYFSILQPLRKIQKAIREYTDSKDSAAVEKSLADLDSANELGILSEDVTELAREVDEYTARINKAATERERILAELGLASRIQNGMVPQVFPRYPDRKDFSAYGTMDTARDVGGDFFDFFLVDDDHLFMMIADVSGKGIPAALFMMASTIIISNNMLEGKAPAVALESANRIICARNEGEMFVTVWLGMLELSTGRLTAVNAGHENPVIMEDGGLFDMVRDRHWPVVGAMEDTVYEEYELQLTPGSRLFLYTDGLPEATDANNKMFGMDRTLIELNKLRSASDEEVLEGMKKAVAGFVKDAEQFDDLTMLCVTYNGPQV